MELFVNGTVKGGQSTARGKLKISQWLWMNGYRLGNRAVATEFRCCSQVDTKDSSVVRLKFLKPCTGFVLIELDPSRNPNNSSGTPGPE